jgi:hypothetical protein
MRTFEFEVERRACEELHNLYTSQTGITILKRKNMRCDWYVTRMKAARNDHKDLIENSDGKNHWKT